MKSITIQALLLILCPAIIIAQPMGGLGNGSIDWDLNIAFFILFIYPIIHLLLVIIPLVSKNVSAFPFVVARLVINLITIILILTTIHKFEEIGILSAIALPLIFIFSISNLFVLRKLNKIRQRR